MTRTLNGIKVEQRTDYMFNATGLAKEYAKSKKIRRGKEVSEFLRLDKTIEFIEALKVELESDTGNIVSVKKGGKEQGTWMHPYLFIDFAMWINPTFKVQVIKFVYDELIKSRNAAGDNYKTLSSSGVKLPGYDFREVAKALQWIVFNKTGKNLRQTATEEQLKELSETQTNLAFAIDMGYIPDYDSLIKAMRKMWNDKNRKF